MQSCIPESDPDTESGQFETSLNGKYYHPLTVCYNAVFYFLITHASIKFQILYNDCND